MTCEECRERLLPGDPSKPFFIRLEKYYRPLCYSCPGFDYQNYISPKIEKTVAIKQTDSKDIPVLKAQVRYLLKKVNEKESKSKKVYTVK